MADLWLTLSMAAESDSRLKRCLMSNSSRVIAFRRRNWRRSAATSTRGTGIIPDAVAEQQRTASGSEWQLELGAWSADSRRSCATRVDAEIRGSKETQPSAIIDCEAWGGGALWTASARRGEWNQPKSAQSSSSSSPYSMSAASPRVVVSLPSVAASEISCDENSASSTGDRKSDISSGRCVSAFQLMIAHWTPTSRWWSCALTGGEAGARRDKRHRVNGSSADLCVGWECERRIGVCLDADLSSVCPRWCSTSLRQRSRRYVRTPRDFTRLRPAGDTSAFLPPVEIPTSVMLQSDLFNVFLLRSRVISPELFWSTSSACYTSRTA